MYKLKNEPTQTEYKESVENKLTEEITENDNIENTITTLNRIIHETAIETLGYSRKNNKHWITDDILDELRKLTHQQNRRIT